MPLYNARRTIQRYGGHFYQLRTASGLEKRGFLVPLPYHLDSDTLYNDVIGAAMRWRVIAIVFFRQPDGSEYRGWCEVTTDQALAAQGDELVPVMRSAIRGAEDEGGESGDIYETVLAMRSFCKGHASMKPVLRRYQRDLGLTDDEICSMSATR